MPKLPKPKKPNYLPDKPKRKPSSDYKTYNGTRWRNMSKRGRLSCGVCEVCQAEGMLTDITPQPRKKLIDRYGNEALIGNWGVLDHVVPVKQGGAWWDQRNHMGMCGHHHNVKRGLEKHGYCVETTQGAGGLIPMDRSEIVLKLIGGEKESYV